MENNEKINQKEILDAFLSFERKEDLGALIIDSVEIWYYIRNLIYEKYIQQKAGIYRPTPPKSKIKWQKLGAKLGNSESNNVDILFFHHRRERRQEYYHCIYTEEIIQSLSRTYTYRIIEEPINKNDCNIETDHYPAKKPEDIIFLDDIGFLNQLKCCIFKHIYIIKLHFSHKVHMLRKSINRELDINIKANEFISIISSCIAFEKTYSPIYQELLNTLSPKVLIEIMIPSFYRFLINKLAHKNGIKIIELQHGLIGRYDPIFYQYEIDSNLYLPDKILTFGSYWNKRARIPIPESNFIDVGFPYFEKKLNQFSKAKIPNNILIISQGYIGKELSRFACDLARTLSTHPQFQNYTVTYKLHPFETGWKDIYPDLLNENINVVEHNQADIYDLMSKSICQIGVYSTAIFEGIGLGLRTFIVKQYGSAELDEIIDRYSCVSNVNNVMDIISFLESDDKDLITCEIDSLKKELWKENSIHNIKKTIEYEMNC